MPFFSVIIPSHQRPELLQRAIKSVLLQTFSDFEVVVVLDEGDEPKIQTAAISDQRIKWKNSTRRGRSAARNEGIDTARGQYLCFLDDDDIYDPTFLALLYEHLKAHHFSDKVVIRTALMHHLKSGHTIKGESYDINKHGSPLAFVLKNMCGVVSCCFPASMLAHHHFDERFSYWEDSHLLMRALVGANLIQMPNALYHYHYHDQMGSNVGQNIEQVAENNLQAIYDYYLNYQHLWRQYLNERDFKVVLAQKHLMYATRSLWYGNKKFGVSSFKKSLKLAILPAAWKEYLLFFYSYCFPKKQIHG